MWPAAELLAKFMYATGKGEKDRDNGKERTEEILYGFVLLFQVSYPLPLLSSPLLPCPCHLPLYAFSFSLLGGSLSPSACVCELGAGVGLSGLVAAHYARHTTLTDR